jgi:hypothetical protein
MDFSDLTYHKGAAGNVGNKSKQGIDLTEEERLLLFGCDAADPTKPKGPADDS